MRILIITQYFWPENFRINELVQEFIYRGHDICVLTGYPNYPDGIIYSDFHDCAKKYENFLGARIVRVPLVARGNNYVSLILNYISFAISASILGPFKLRGDDFDIIFVYEPSPILVGLPAVVLRALKKAPVVFWVLDLWPETLKAIGIVKSQALLSLVSKLVSFIYNRCDLILAQSKNFKPQIKKYARLGADVRYFPSWADSNVNLAQIVPAAEVPIKGNSFDVMFTGNIGEAQDFPSILLAAELLKSHSDIRWLIVGDGRMSDWVRHEIKRKKLGDCVLLLGRYPVERMPSFFKHADALLVSLKDEQVFSMTIPAKLQSYLAAGKPIVAMLNGEGAEIIQSSGAGLVCPSGDYNALAGIVMDLYHATDVSREIMASNGLEVSACEFDRDKLITKLESWFVELKKGN